VLALQPNHLLTTRIDISTTSREELDAILNQQLADLFNLYSQTKQALGMFAARTSGSSFATRMQRTIGAQT
jgi:hypothetical protein